MHAGGGGERGAMGRPGFWVSAGARTRALASRTPARDPDGLAGKRPSRRRLMRAMRVSLVTLASLELAYVVAVNGFLSTPLFEKVINGDPDTIAIHYRTGWSLVPGRIHASGLSIRGRDRRVEWLLRIDEADFTMSFLALARREFTVSRVHGAGLSFRLRQRLARPPATPEEAASLPPIDGFGPYSVRPDTAPGSDLWSDADYRLWTAHLEEITAADVRELWIDHVRFEGSAAVSGRFYLKPLRAVEVGPAVVLVHVGRVSRGASTLAEGLAGSRADLTVERFDPRTSGGGDIAHRASLDLDVHGSAPEMSALPWPLPARATLAGPLEVSTLAVVVTRGVVCHPSRLEAQAPRTTLSAGEHHVTGALSLTGEISDVDGSDRLTLRGDVARLAVAPAATIADGDVVAGYANGVVVRADARALDLARPLADLHVALSVPQVSLEALKHRADSAPGGGSLAVSVGPAHGSAELSASFAERRLSGRFTVSAATIDARSADHTASGEASAEASFGAWAWDTNRLEDARLSVLITQLALARAGVSHASSARVLRLRADAHVTEAELGPPLRKLAVSVAIHEGALVVRDLPIASRARGSASQLELQGLSAAGHLVVREAAARGAFELRAKQARLASRGLSVTGEVSANARAHAGGRASGPLVIESATIDARGVAVRRRGESAAVKPAIAASRISVSGRSARFALADPWATLTLEGAVVDAHVNDASVLHSLASRSRALALASEGGRFSGEVLLDVDDHVARGRLLARAKGLAIVASPVVMAADVDLSASVARWDMRHKTLTDAASHVVARGIKGRVLPHTAWDFGADRVELWARAANVDLARPTWRDGEGRLVIDHATLPDASALQALMRPQAILDIESGRARLSADVSLSAAKSTADGWAELEIDGASLWFHEVHLAGDLRALARVRGFDSASRSLDLSGSEVSMSDVSVKNASTNATGWRGHASLAGATLQIAPTVIDAAVTLDARDANPILAALFRRSLSPFVASMTTMPELHATTRLTVGSERLALQGLVARGGDLDLRGGYVARGGHRHAAFVATKGAFSVGVWAADSGPARLRFFSLDRWLREQSGIATRLWESK